MKRTEEVRVECRILELNLLAVGQPDGSKPREGGKLPTNNWAAVSNPRISVWSIVASSLLRLFHHPKLRKEVPRIVSERLTWGHFISVQLPPRITNAKRTTAGACLRIKDEPRRTTATIC